MEKVEQWVPIEEAPSYAVSSLGRVKRLTADKLGRYCGLVMRTASRRGYKAVNIWTLDGRKLTRSVHRLVCRAFHGEPPSADHQAAHKDGDKSNNIPQNLYWATAKQNVADCHRHGTAAIGDRHWTRVHPENVLRGARHYKRLRPGTGVKGEAVGTAKLSEDQVREIRAFPQYRGSGKELAERYGVTMGLISAIRKRRIWRHLDAHDHPPALSAS